MAERLDRDLYPRGDGATRDDGTRETGSGGRATSGRSNRGFASMDRERQKEIASKGGRAAHAKGTAHEWTSDEARNAGRKGGETVSRDRAHMAAIGREGGGARSARNRGGREDQQQQDQQSSQLAEPQGDGQNG